MLRKAVIIKMDTTRILELAKENNGIVTTSMVIEAGISRGILKYLVDIGKLERSARGVYILPGTWDDEFVNMQTRFKKGIYSHETALFLCDLTDRTPSSFNMVFPATYNLSGPKEFGIRCSSVREPLYSLGVVSMKTPAGNPVRCYCAERALCDIMNRRSHTDIQIVADAFRRYTAGNEKNIMLLMDYADKLSVRNRIMAYLEVLL